DQRKPSRVSGSESFSKSHIQEMNISATNFLRCVGEVGTLRFCLLVKMLLTLLMEEYICVE
ncbi:MAG: hypothetical protein N3F66_15295, partial [Spirochaetes bacterium]|nr:hypothetical protein [Spirochaetota bacterium]